MADLEQNDSDNLLERAVSDEVIELEEYPGDDGSDSWTLTESEKRWLQELRKPDPIHLGLAEQGGANLR